MGRHLKTDHQERSSRRRWWQRPITAAVAAALVISGIGTGIAALAADDDSNSSGDGGTGAGGTGGGTADNYQYHWYGKDTLQSDHKTPVQGYDQASINYMMNANPYEPKGTPNGGKAAWEIMPKYCGDALAEADDRAQAAHPGAPRGKSRVVFMFFAGSASPDWPWGWGAVNYTLVRDAFNQFMGNLDQYTAPEYRANPSYRQTLQRVFDDGYQRKAVPLGNDLTVFCLALNQFEPPMNVTYQVSGVTQQQGGFPVSGGTQSVSARVTLSRPPAGDGEPVNATFTLNWDSAAQLGIFAGIFSTWASLNTPTVNKCSQI